MVIGKIERETFAKHQLSDKKKLMVNRTDKHRWSI